MQHTSFGPTPFTNVRTPSSDAIDLRQGRSDGYDKPAYAGSKLSGTRHGGVFFEVYFGWSECPGQGVFVLSHSGCILLCQWV